MPGLRDRLNGALRWVGRWSVRTLGVLALLVVGAGLSALFLLDDARRARVVDWIYERMDRVYAESRAPDVPGFLSIEAPQVYTRERLVNDRFRQANWLARELEWSSGDEARSAFDAASAAQRSMRSDWVRARLAGSSGERATSQAALGAVDDEIALERLDDFARRLRYRDEVRAELMDTLLDDGHDLDGNTLYRLNFDASVVPWEGRRRSPGTAVFVVTIGKPRHQGPADRARDDLELLRDWEREMQQFLGNVLHYRLEQFHRDGGLNNPTDPKEAVAFEWFLRRELVEAFLEFVAWRTEDCTQRVGDDGPCRVLAPSLRTKLVDEVAAWLGLAYRDHERGRVPEIEDRDLRQRFADAIERVRAIDVERTMVARALTDPSCLSENQQSYVPQDAPPGTPALPCPTLLIDHSGQRSLIRMISVLRELHARVPTVPMFDLSVGDGGFETRLDRAAFIAGFERFLPEPSATQDWRKARLDGGDRPVVAATEGTDPLGALAPAAAACPDYATPHERIGHQFVAFERERRFKCLSELAGSYFHDLANTYNQNTELLTAFIIERLINEHLPGYNLERQLGDFVEVEPEGCGLTTCRIAIRARRTIDEAEIARALRVGVGEEAECFRELADAGKMNLPLMRDLWDAVVFEEDDAPPFPASFDAQIGAGPAMTRLITWIRLNTPTPTVKQAWQPAEELWVDRSAGPAEYFAACRLRHWLDERGTDVDVYALSPRQQSEVVTSEAAQLRGLDVGGEAGTVSAAVGSQGEDAVRRIVATPYVLGFSQLIDDADGGATMRKRERSAFGWIVRPRADANGTFMPGHHRFSAVVSVPSWLRRLQVEVEACWIEPSAAPRLGEEVLNAPSDICHTVGERGGELDRTYLVHLPRRVEEVTAQFKFEVIKTPYFDFAWTQQPIENREVEVGRRGQIVLQGERLWRGTVVTLGQQQADTIIVLPDMRGVIAEFACVRAPAGLPHVVDMQAAPPPEGSGHARMLVAAGTSADPAGNRSPAQSIAEVVVWTAEGRTVGIPVRLQPFIQRVAGERPCFEERTR